MSVFENLGLPITDVLSDLLHQITISPIIVLQAPPGAGKSTIVPLAMLDNPSIKGKKILMLEPRRLAAKSIAERMAGLLHEKVGETVGYRIRFETKVSKHTKIEVITEGILTRMLMDDNTLDGIGMIIFDEFHERSIHADLSLALARECQEVLRPDLRLLIMSATLDVKGIANTLNAPTIISEGRMHPVEVNFSRDANTFELGKQCAKFVEEIHKKTKGDLLVFLPGQSEIMQTIENLRGLSGTIVRPLYGTLPFSQQWKAIQPSQEGKRRIVIATSIAETSLTIEGITTVVDSGYGRGVQYDPGSGLSRLITYRISKDEADQRSGRAGRLGPGQAYRMWSMSTQDKMKAHRTPEIESQDLTSLCLSLASWGNTNAETLLWMSPPPEGTLLQGFDLLEDLGAVANRKITPTGKEMDRLPCHPRIAHMLLEAHKIDQVHLAADIAAIIEEKDPLPRDTGPDLSLRVEWLRRKRADKDTGFTFIRLDRVSSSYTQLFQKETSIVPFDPYDCGLLLSFAYPERIGNAQGARSGRFQLANGHIVKLPQKDDLSAEAWLAVANMDARDNLGKVYLASAINPKDLASQVKEVDIIKWDKKKKAVSALHQKRVGSLVLASKTISNPDEAVILDILIGEVKKSKGILLPFNEEVIQWLNRAELVSQHSPDLGLPDVKKESLIRNCETWLTPYLSGIVSAEELQQLDLLEILSYSLDVSQQEMMKAWAPERIVVPSGSNLKINYRPNGQSPFLEVRIQELFGMNETPAVCTGKQKILLHLLSPGYKPVQVTDDLESFWSNTYFEVKKELKRRYPKHWWPENPNTAEPTSRAKPRKKN